MLTGEFLDVLPNRIIDLYHEYEDSVIADIARRLASADMTATAAWQMQRMIDAGGVYENALKEIARLTGRSEAELAYLFEKAGVRTIQFDDRIYKAVGLKPLPLNLSPAMAHVLAAGLQRTSGIMQNMTLTTAMNAQQAFIQAADLAYMQVSTGAMSYDQAIRAAVKSVGESGLFIQYPSGRKDRLDVAMRRTVLTGVAQTTGQLQLTRADELGVDLVQTSAHIGARPSHEPWQGKIFSRSGEHPKYPPFVESTGYGTVTGLMGINCRHTFFPFFEGLSKNAYTRTMLEDMADERVTYKGREMSVYEATQMQRRIERQIRDWKRQASALGAAGLDNTAEIAQVREWQARARDFVKQTGLSRQYVREGGGVRVIKLVTKKAPPIAPLAEVFIPAKTYDEAIERLSAFWDGREYYAGYKIGNIKGVNFEGLKLETLNSVLAGIEGVSGKYGTKFSYIGYQWKPRKSLGAHFRSLSDAEAPAAIGIQKTFLRNPAKVADRSRESFLSNLKRNIDYYKNALADVKRPLELREKAGEKLNILERLKRWGIFSEEGVDPVEAVVRHENYHGLYYKKALEDLFSRALNRNGVNRDDWYFVSEYGGSDRSELFAELAVALDMGIEVPENLKQAMIETLESLK